MMRTMNVCGRGMPGPMGMQKSRCGLPLSLGAAYGSRRADGPGKMEWRIRRPGYWRPPRQMDSWFEEQLIAYPEDALTLAPLHLGGVASPAPSMWPVPAQGRHHVEILVPLSSGAVADGGAGGRGLLEDPG